MSSRDEARPATLAAHEQSAPASTTITAGSENTSGNRHQSDEQPSRGGIRTAAAKELGPDVAAQLPDNVDKPARPTDPGAAALVASMLNQLGHRAIDAQGTTTVTVRPVVNQSHATEHEFEAFMERFATLLSDAGRADRMVFTLNGDQTQYRMLGTAYLISADGFDQWELFITLSPADRDYTVWHGPSAVRVLRQPRPGQAQVFIRR